MADLFGGQPISLEQMLGSVRREVGLRRRVYPRLVDAGRMKSDDAERETLTMFALEELLERLVARRITRERLEDLV